MEYTLEKLQVYQLAESFSDKIWKLVHEWSFFERDTVGKQMVRSADSISANIAEGYGGFYYNESKQFYFYARGSLLETKSWITKCKRRNIIDESICNDLLAETEVIIIKLNSYIRFVKNSKQHNIKAAQ